LLGPFDCCLSLLFATLLVLVDLNKKFEFTTSDVYCGGMSKILLVSTMCTKWDIEKFSNNNDIELWKVKLKAILIQQKCLKALNDEALMSAI